jgi:hypothetical protein
MYNGARVKVVQPQVGYTDLKDEPEDGRRYEVNAHRRNTMLRSRFVALGLLVAAGCAPQSTERQLVTDAANAMGGADRIQAIRTLVIEGEGQNFNLGQNLRPDGDLPVFKVTSMKRTIDFAGGRWRQEQLREPTFPSGNPAPQRQITALDGDVAFNVPPSGRRSAWARRSAGR